MTKKKTLGIIEKNLYKNKLFYEVISEQGFDAKVLGPLKWIHYIKTQSGESSEFKYAQVINGEIRQVFRAHEIFETEKKI